MKIQQKFVPMRIRKTIQKGFTLVELMITVALVAITLSFALPSFEIVFDRNNLVSSTNMIIGGLNYGRVEATKQGQDINVGGITNGWGVWRDDNANNAYDAGEELRVFDDPADSVTLTSTLGVYTFEATGFADAAGSITLCSDNAALDGRQIAVALSGRIQVTNVACP